MARGWESKAIEAQLDEAERAAQESVARRRLSPELIERAQRRESLRLLRSRLLEQLSNARSVAQQQHLKRALADLEERLATLE